jgi:hypothetical protein
MSNFIAEACASLRPEYGISVENDDIKKVSWAEDCVDIPTDVEITAEATRLQAEYDAQAYARARQYPAIGDQLDALFHAGVFPAEMAATLQAVKDAHPKP